MAIQTLCSPIIVRKAAILIREGHEIGSKLQGLHAVMAAEVQYGSSDALMAVAG
jgi:hypothetical protein